MTMTTGMITARSRLLRLGGSGIVCLMLAGVSEARVPRAFVSINGNDLNPCSAVQPCRSFNQALTVVQPGGEIIVQDSGGYSTGFTITQSVTIDAAGFNASVISTNEADLCTINTVGRVVLRGISFHGGGVGNHAINATQVGSLYVEHCSISEFGGNGVNMPNGGNLFVASTDVRGCFNGILLETTVTNPANLVAHDSRFTECADGVLVQTLGAAAKGLLSDCTASLCSNNGFKAFAIAGLSNVYLALTNCRASLNTNGITADGSVSGGFGIIVLTKCVVTSNTIGLNLLKGFLFGTDPGTNLVTGNVTDHNTLLLGPVPLI
jgi:hypothetical protein